jgi:hypothetical protein
MKLNILKFLSLKRCTVSMSQGRRAVFQGQVNLEHPPMSTMTPITDFTQLVEVEVGDVIHVGQRSFLITEDLPTDVQS